jgi:hypothetical protein
MEKKNDTYNKDHMPTMLFAVYLHPEKRQDHVLTFYQVPRMIRLWLAFIIFAVLIHFGITVWRKMERKEQWSLTKTAFYSIIVSLLALAVIVILF